MTMPNEQIYPRQGSQRASGTGFGAQRPGGPVIDQDGREIPQDYLRGATPGSGGFRFDFQTANPFGNLSRDQRILRLEAIAKLLDAAFILPGTNIRYGIDGIIGMIPVVGDIIATGLSLWVVREARALGAPWHLTARMLGNVAVQGTIGAIPLAGDAFDVLFRANMRNARLLRRWLDTQPR